MAQAPTVETPPRVPLVFEPANRDDSTEKDARLVNCYGEKTPDGEWQLYKRPGLLSDATLSRPSAATGRGIYNWRGDILAVFNGNLYENGTSVGSVANSGMYHFSQTLGTTPYLFIDNGTTAYTWDGTTLTQVTDGDFPASRVPGSGYLDATTYVMTSAAKISGSDFNTPSAWDPLNVIIAQIEPDLGVALSKQLVYIIAHKEWTTEVFYDAQNASGSPLGTVQGAKQPYGCKNGESVQSMDDVLYWLSTTRSASAQIVRMENLKTEVISTAPVERLLDNSALSTVYSWTFKDEGHSFYVLTIPGLNLTLAYDVRQRLWWQMTDASGNYFPIIASTYNSDMKHLVQHATNGKIYELDRSHYTDDGSVIDVNIYAPNFDAGTGRRKVCNRLLVIGDQQQGSMLYVRTNDEDYKPEAWSMWRTFDLSQPMPYLSNFGTFTRRAHHFRHVSPTPMRLRGVEIGFDLGVL